MFDTVGRDLDEAARRRQVTSALLTTTAGALLAAGLACVGWMTARTTLSPAAEPEADPVLYEIALEDVDEGPQGAPAPPARLLAQAPRLRAGEAQDAPRDAPPPTPDEPSEPVWRDRVEAVQRDAASPTGGSDGSDNVDGGPVVGAGDGPGGTGDGPGLDGTGQGPAAFRPYSGAVVRRRVDPRYPDAARGMAADEVVCLATVQVDAEGVPSRVDVTGCGPAFHDEVLQALPRWRFYPARQGRDRVAASYRITVRFRQE